MAQPTLQEWQDYLGKLGEYHDEVTTYVNNYNEGGENPLPPLPPKPPSFTGWEPE
jgi:hypothetical protein